MLITKTFTFDAAHQLHSLPDDHKCRRMHGHTYRCRLTVERVGFGGVNLRGTALDEHGMIVDYAVLADVWQKRVHDVIDHRYLNDIPGLEKPTTEVLAAWIFHRFVDVDLNGAHITFVRVYESADTYAEFP
jgi:6-pyruvoyltetrahydropterin/6-carboxytetrahydropterin synthase